MRIVIPTSIFPQTIVTVTDAGTNDKIVTLDHRGSYETAPWVRDPFGDNLDMHACFYNFCSWLHFRYDCAQIVFLWRRDETKDCLAPAPWIAKLMQRLKARESLVTLCEEYAVSVGQICHLLNLYDDDYLCEDRIGIIFDLEDAMETPNESPWKAPLPSTLSRAELELREGIEVARLSELLNAVPVLA
ncbi:MAG: hypothetical protein ACAF41_12580 [Leptolyngbya sp. BL-A-14]